MMNLVDQSNPCAQIYLQKNYMLLKFATTNSNFVKNQLFLTCVIVKRTCIINFQQNRVSKSVKTVRTNIFAKNYMLLKFATTNSNFVKNQLFLTCVIVKRTCIINFQQNRVNRAVITVHTNNLHTPKICKLHKFATTNSNY